MEIDTLFQSGQLFFCLKVLNTLTTNLIVSNTSDWYHKVYGGWKPEGLVIALTKIATKCDAPSRCFHFLAALQHLFSKVLVHCSIRVTAKVLAWCWQISSQYLYRPKVDWLLLKSVSSPFPRSSPIRLREETPKTCLYSLLFVSRSKTIFRPTYAGCAAHNRQPESPRM